MCITIRAVELKDAEQLRMIYSQSNVQENMLQLPMPSVKYWENRIGSYSENGWIGFVAELNSVVVGEIVLFTEKNIRLKHVVSFGVAVDENFSGRGIGRKLIIFCQEYAFQWLGAKRLELQVFVSNQVAIKLYESMGFEIEGRKKKAALKNGDYQDVFVMSKLGL